MEQQDLFHDLADEDELALFQKHFIVMNALYQLQSELWEGDQIFLDISSVRVRFVVSYGYQSASSAEKDLTDNLALSGYYLDWENYNSTNQEQVIKMLNGFWDLYYNQDKVFSAYEILDLERGEPIDSVTKQYRKLAAIHHPDKGGKREDFIAIRQAYEVIKQSNNASNSPII